MKPLIGLIATINQNNTPTKNIELKGIIDFTVLKILGENKYLIGFGTREFTVISTQKLYLNESIQARAINKRNNLGKIINNEQSFSTELQILKRNSVNKSILQNEISNMELPRKFINQIFTNSIKEEISIQTIFKMLHIYYPEIKFNEDGVVYNWQLSDGEAEAFYEKTPSNNSISIHFSMNLTGKSVFHLNWSKEDLSDIIIRGVFAKQAVYEFCLNHKDILGSFLKHFKIRPLEVLLQYRDISKGEQREWNV